jgi:hypothetical protein
MWIGIGKFVGLQLVPIYCLSEEQIQVGILVLEFLNVLLIKEKQLLQVDITLAGSLLWKILVPPFIQFSL